MSSQNVYLPMEIFHREYPGKLALALALVEMGNKVHIGYNHFIRNMALESNRGGVYFEIKGKSPKGMDYLSKIRERGVLLVGQDEEAGISYLNFNDFVLNRPEVSGVGFMDKFFAWGLDDFEYYSSHFNGQSEIKQTGSARSLFWGESGKKFYQDEIQVTQNTFGKYILIITNLASRNNLMSKRQMKKFTLNAGYGKDFYKAYSKRQTWENLAYPRIVELINRVTRDTNLKVILRPHPSEDVVQWNSEFANNKKVIISKIGNVAPLIFAADHVIHAGSTVGLEAMLSGISTISYQDIVAYEDYPMTANYYSSKASSITNLVDMLNSNESYLPLAGFANVVSNKLTAANNMTLVREMAFAINSSQAKSKNYSQEKDLTLTEIRKESFLHRMIDRIQYGKSAYSDIHSHKRPKLSTVQVTKDFHRLSRIIDSNLEVGISEIGESSFTISNHY